ncbi:MAG: prepilin-type N-terminal cleavage/methylation domain-containing protein [Patescibacteria group bacterium]|nr:prepilin-type N-terminal cleavage/methylation domain-containing protein [Patescibacteria group bacterium]
MRIVQNYRKGFTMIELITVIAVIAILSAMVMRIIDPFEQFKKANDGRRKSDLSQIQRALEQYYQDNGRYPSSTTDPGSEYKIMGVDGSTINWGTLWSPYMNMLPSDPNKSKTYVYYSSEDGQSYYLYASLDRGGKDPQSCHPGQEVKCDNAPDDVCGGICSYGVTSPNVNP